MPNVKVNKPKVNGSKGKKRKALGVSTGNKNEKKEWYQANYTVYLSNSGGKIMRKDEILVTSSKSNWEAKDTGHQMMLKVCQTITEKSTMVDINRETATWDLHMGSEMIWKYLWAYFENQTYQI